MKKLIISIGLGLVLWLPVHAQTNSEQVQAIDAKFAINKDASVSVVENIAYNFGSEQHHGIFRDIPYKYSRNGINYNISISDVSVNDFSENPYEFTSSKTNGNYEIKIGDPDTYVTGVHDYRIRYTVRGAINYFSDHDEFYWNVVGSGWTVPIGGPGADVKLPPGTVTSQAKASCFWGAIGSTQPCLNINTYGDSYSFSSQSVAPGQAFTVVISMPKGAVYQPTRWQVLGKTITDNIIFLLPVLVLFLMWSLWRVRGRDPKPSIPVVAQYETPNGLTPVEVGYLVDERTQNFDISAEIIYLATLGYLKIERIPKVGIFGHEDFKLNKLKSEADLPNEFDRKLLSKLFSFGDEVLLSELKSQASVSQSSLEAGKVAVKLTADGYFTKNPGILRGEYMIGAGVAVFLILFFLSDHVQWSTTFSLALSGLIVIIFGYFMPRKTQKGADTKQLVLGLKEYLSVAEKDRLNFHNDPEKNPQLFEKLLPYAMALGVSEAWAKKFEGLFDYRPSWYADPTQAYFNFLIFNSAISNFNSNFNTAVAASTHSAGAGGSGFGGGGFSGGGFGGGGGGSW
ncbi:MAG TPA: DUF2207 domain-containing protein [Patescibacteria group bacterium]|nr:DUF2207 domain-containing protein [Patescibacteria group bacterium]